MKYYSQERQIKYELFKNILMNFSNKFYVRLIHAVKYK